MIISPGRGYVFVHIPKTGGTSMALALEDRAMADDILIGDTPKARHRRRRLAKLSAPGRLWKHSRLSDIDGIEELPNSPFVFTMVRNPWDRVVSLYHWARVQSFEHPLVSGAKELRFRDFVLSPALARAASNDASESYVKDAAGTVKCDAFVRLEHLDSDLRPVERHLGFPLHLPHANVSDHPSSATLYDEETRNRVDRLFAPDIARFGYAFPGA